MVQLYVYLIMPGGLSGRDVAIRAREIKPGVKALLTSGYAEELVRGDDLQRRKLKGPPQALPTVGLGYSTARRPRQRFNLGRCKSTAVDADQSSAPARCHTKAKWLRSQDAVDPPCGVGLH